MLLDGTQGIRAWSGCDPPSFSHSLPDDANRSEASGWKRRKTSDPLGTTHESMCHKVPSADRGTCQDLISSKGETYSIRHRKGQLGDELFWPTASVPELFGECERHFDCRLYVPENQRTERSGVIEQQQQLRCRGSRLTIA
jgi:hypothetical protein